MLVLMLSDQSGTLRESLQSLDKEICRVYGNRIHVAVGVNTTERKEEVYDIVEDCDFHHGMSVEVFFQTEPHLGRRFADLAFRSDHSGLGLHGYALLMDDDVLVHKYALTALEKEIRTCWPYEDAFLTGLCLYAGDFVSGTVYTAQEVHGSYTFSLYNEGKRLSSDMLVYRNMRTSHGIGCTSTFLALPLHILQEMNSSELPNSWEKSDLSWCVQLTMMFPDSPILYIPSAVCSHYGGNTVKAVYSPEELEQKYAEEHRAIEQSLKDGEFPVLDEQIIHHVKVRKGTKISTTEKYYSFLKTEEDLRKAAQGDPDYDDVYRKFCDIYSLPDDGRKKVLFYAQNNGCGFVRADVPAAGVNQGNRMYIAASPAVSGELLRWADVFVWQGGPTTEMLGISKVLRDIRPDMLQFADYDDNYLIGPYKGHSSKTQVDPAVMLTQLNMLDGVIFENERLAEYVSSLMKQLPSWKPSCVLPNYVNPYRFSANIRPNFTASEWNGEEPFRILWYGGDSHTRDLQIAVPALLQLQKEGNIEVHFMGWSGHTEVLHSRRDLFPELVRIQHPWTSIENFHGALCRTYPHLVLCPVEDQPFNTMGKSPLKYLESACCAFPVLASDIPPYSEVIRDRETGFLCTNSTEDWYREIRYCMENASVLPAVGKKGQKEVLEKYSIFNNSEHYEDVFLDMCRKAVE